MVTESVPYACLGAAPRLSDGASLEGLRGFLELGLKPIRSQFPCYFQMPQKREQVQGLEHTLYIYLRAPDGEKQSHFIPK